MRKPTLLIVSVLIPIAIIIGLFVSVFLVDRNNNPYNDTPINDNSIDWQMHAYFLSADNSQTAMNITIQGVLNNNGNSPNKLENLIITYPDEFSYSGHRYTGSDPIPNLNQEFNLFPNESALFYSSAIAYHKQTGAMSTENWVICFDKGFYISLFENEPNCYLVASLANGTKPEEIVEYFSDFIEWFRLRHWKNT